MQGPETRASLLANLSDPASEEAWTEFAAIYRPLVYRVARAKGLQHADAEDLAQEVLAIVGRAIESFEGGTGQSFRGWLFSITRNLVVNHLTRSKGPIGSGDSDVQMFLQALPSPDDDTSTLFQMEYRRCRFQQAACKLKPSFSPSTWNAFWLTAVEGRTTESVAEELGKSPGAVRVAKCRVIAMIRKEVLNDEG